MKKHLLLSLVLPAAALAIGLAPHAALADYSCNTTTMTCTGSYDTGYQATDLSTSPNPTTNVAIQQFDTQGGQYYLTSVSVTFTGSIQSSGTITNTNDASLTYTVGVDSLYTASAISSQLATLVAAINGAALDPEIKQTGGTIAGNSTTDFVPTAPFTSPRSASTGALNLADLTDFESSSPTLLTATVKTKSTVSQSTTGGGGNLAVTTDLTTTADGQLTYTYTYAQTPVPEPASMALLGSGLFGLGWVRRRRAAKRG